VFLKACGSCLCLIIIIIIIIAITCFRSKKVASRADHQKSEETIERVWEAQTESSKMHYRPIAPAKSETLAGTTAKRYLSGITFSIHA